VRAPLVRLLAVTAALSIGLGAIGLGWTAVQIGLGDAGSAARIERDIRHLVADRGRLVRTLAERVSRNVASVDAAIASREGLAALFSQLSSHTAVIGTDRVSATVYVPSGPSGGHRVLAWSDGPAEDVQIDRLIGPAALFAAQGTGGLRLVFVQPIASADRRSGVATAETILSPTDRPGSETYRLHTPSGPVTLTPALYAGRPAVGRSRAFVIADPAGAPLLEARFDLDAVAGARRTYLSRVASIALAPFAVLGLLLTGRLVAWRARRAGAPTSRAYLGRTAAAGLGVVAGAAALIGLSRLAAAPAPLVDLLVASTTLALAVLFPVSFWWRGRSRRRSTGAPAGFVLEQILGGAGLALALVTLSGVLHRRFDGAALEKWRSPLLPVDAGALLLQTTLLLLAAAFCWTTGALLASLVHRWRLTSRRPGTSLAAILLWALPSAAVLGVPSALHPLPVGGWLLASAAVLVFAWVAAPLRRYYRRTTQAMRLLFLFAALLLPTLAIYPITAFHADATSRRLIEHEYAPAAAAHPQQLRRQLAEAQREIDGIGGIHALVAGAPRAPVSSRFAHTVWVQTNLSQSRVTSDLELYGPDRTLVSRFALNIPEYLDRTAVRSYAGTTCTWRVFDDLRRFGAEERLSLRAERGLCDADGRVLGAVVVQVVPDHRALPFVSEANPYAEAVGSPGALPRESHVPDLQVAIYGWSLATVFTSGRSRVAWPITPDLFARLYASRDPFWTTLTADGQPYRVYFTSDRAQIYALGYPVATPFEHATRLAEAAALTAVVLIVLLAGAAAYTPFAGRPTAPLRALFLEIRTSFYRKLFLFFVLAAVGPVVLLALAFGAYMTAKFEDDVKFEAANVVTVARRVLQELGAGRADVAPTAPTDDVMVWIRQVIDQDVNLFERADLVATSQRDLFDSGLLPTRTPAAAYRKIALERLPTFVTEDRLGSFQYLVAAAPVPSRGQDAVLSVPLALRQREIEREIDELNRGVLVGAVLVVLFAAGLGASVAGRVSDPVARLTRATRQIAAGRLDVRIVADTADELRRLVDDFNSMAATLGEQRTALARANQLKAWNEMARQVAHEIKNPLTPIQLAAEHLQRVHEDRGRPLGAVFDQCTTTVLRQVRLLRQIAGEFANFAGEPSPTFTAVQLGELVAEVIAAYRTGLSPRHVLDVNVPGSLPPIWVDRTLLARALTNLVENALQAMPTGGTLSVSAAPGQAHDVILTVTDTGVGMDAEGVTRAFEPYFSTKTAGSGLGLPNAKRNIELCRGTIRLTSERGHGTTVTVTLPAAPPPGVSGAA
jgi:signal transduction histidine kinase